MNNNLQPNLHLQLAHIRTLNRNLGLPHQENDATIFSNGGIFEVDTLRPDSIALPPYRFDPPLSGYPPEERISIICEYGIRLGVLNAPKTVSVEALDINPSSLFIGIDTQDINRAGYWVLVRHTVFLFDPLPFCTLDFIAPSTVRAEPGQFRAPEDTIFRRPPDIGPPN